MNDLANGYSADIRLELRVNGHALELEQIGPSDCIVRRPCELPPSPAEVIMHIDGFERRWPVELVDGISLSSPVVKYVDRAE